MQRSVKRSGGGSLRDPVLGLALSAVGLPTMYSLMRTVDNASTNLGWSLPGQLFTIVWILLLGACCYVASKPALKLTRAVKGAFQQSQALKDLPGPSYGLLGILPLLRARRDFHRLLTEWANIYGPIYHFRVAMFHVVVITDPVLGTHVLRSKMLDKVRFQYHFLDPFLGGVNVLTGPTDEHWRAVRKGVASAFSAQRMRDACHVVAESAMQLVGIVAASPEVPKNVDNLLLRESMDVIGKIGFNKQMGALAAYSDPKAEDIAETMVRGTHEVTLRIYELYRVQKWWKADVQAGKQLLARFKATVGELLQHIKVTPQAPGSFASLLLSTPDPVTHKPLADKLMLPEIAALFFAGIDTTGHTGTWVLYLLSQYPQVEQKLLQELDSMQLLATRERSHPRLVTPADLGRLIYLQAIIKETLRMYPPVGIGQVRHARKHDITLAGKLHLPRGTMLMVPHQAMHNVSFNWDKPSEFIPERWLQSGTEYADMSKLALPAEWYEALSFNTSRCDDSRDAGEGGSSLAAKRYMPFAEGARDCLGQNLAKTSMIATIATLVSHLHFDLADKMKGSEGVRAAEQYTLVTGLSDGMWMTAKLRIPPLDQQQA